MLHSMPGQDGVGRRVGETGRSLKACLKGQGQLDAAASEVSDHICVGSPGIL